MRTGVLLERQAASVAHILLNREKDLIRSLYINVYLQSILTKF